MKTAKRCQRVQCHSINCTVGLAFLAGDLNLVSPMARCVVCPVLNATLSMAMNKLSIGLGDVVACVQHVATFPHQ